jgi:thiol-disulfide isomerase/thioredoxin
MRSFIVPAVVVGLAALAQGCHRDATEVSKDATGKPQDSMPSVALKVGDPAPKLKVDHWLQGAEVTEFAPGKIYVVEFWATWCGPCIAIMPHMGELQSEFRDKGVTFIGFSAWDENNTYSAVSSFVAKRGLKLGYTFAFADDRETYNAWMKAAGQQGIPCCFVVDRAGKIAYIGHPMYLDLILAKVVAGTWSDQDMKALPAIEAEVNGVLDALRKQDAEAGLKALAGLDSKYPELSKIPYFSMPRIGLLMYTKKYSEAKQAAEAALAKALKQEDISALQQLSMALRSPALKEQKELADVAVQVAEAGLKAAGDKDIMALINVAETYFAAGNTAKAREYGALAIAAAPTPQQKQNLEKRVKMYN